MNAQTLEAKYPEVYKEVYDKGLLEGLSVTNPQTLKAELIAKTITAAAKNDPKAEQLKAFEEEVDKLLGLKKKHI